VGTFMLRIKLPAGHLTPAKLRAIGEVSNRYGRGDGELATRQNIQLHWLELAALPEVFSSLTRRASRRPAAAATPCATSLAARCRGSTEQSSSTAQRSSPTPRASSTATRTCDLPRKHKYTIAACADPCNAPEINCIALVGVIHERCEGFAVRVGGGLTSVRRLSREMGVFVPKAEAVEVLAAITVAWSEDLRYRVSRVKARLKFMVDDIGAEGMRARVEERLGRRLADFRGACDRAA
jgi:sulfite reductase beta subunit-like hemoprotein